MPEARRNRWTVRLPLTFGERERVRIAAARIRSRRGGRYGAWDYIADCVRRCLSKDCATLEIQPLPTGRENSEL